jgi:hypothetical protein
MKVGKSVSDKVRDNIWKEVLSPYRGMCVTKGFFVIEDPIHNILFRSILFINHQKINIETNIYINERINQNKKQ